MTRLATIFERGIRLGVPFFSDIISRLKAISKPCESHIKAVFRLWGLDEVNGWGRTGVSNSSLVAIIERFSR